MVTPPEPARENVEALVPLTRATEDWADAELEAAFTRLNPEIQRRVGLLVMEKDALAREVARLTEELEVSGKLLASANSDVARFQEAWDGLAEERERLREALQAIVLGTEEARDHCDDLEDTGAHVGYTRYEQARTDGKAWAAFIANRALAASEEPGEGQ